MTAKESLNRDYDLLLGFLKSVSLRLRFSIALEILLLFSCGFILILLGTLFTLKLKETFPYLPFLYGLMAIVFLCALIFLGLWRVVFRPSRERVARGLGGNLYSESGKGRGPVGAKFPHKMVVNKSKSQKILTVIP